ncbi:hypothetical protein Q7W06_00835, partial [Streptococcus suis]|nr:hypothetical protein [Streptococcus suis]
IGLTTTLKNAWTTSRQVNFFWVANFNLKFGFLIFYIFFPNFSHISCDIIEQNNSQRNDYA